MATAPTKPRIQHVVVLRKIAATGLLTGFLECPGDVDIALRSYHAGIRCPHQSCREMHQSRMLRIQRK